MLSLSVRVGLLLGVMAATASPARAEDDDYAAQLARELLPPAETISDLGWEFDRAASDCNIVIAARPDYPRLVLNSPGPIGVVRALAFSPDSLRVYSAGTDKRVQVWGIQSGERSIRRAGPNRPVLTYDIRWEIARGPRGVIYALAASPVERRLAIAGYAARNSTGDIIVYDTGRLQVERALRAHMVPVVSLDYSPDGKHLVSVSNDGEVRLWSEANNWQSVIVQPRRGFRATQQPARFVSATEFIISVPADDTGAQWRLALYSTGNPQQAIRQFAHLHSRGVTLAATRTRATWASADLVGNVYLWNGTEDQQPRALRRGRIAMSMDFDTQDRLFVGTALPLTTPKQSVIEMWDTRNPGAEPNDVVQAAVTEHNFACKVSPDGSQLASCAADDEQVHLYRLKDEAGQVIDKPLSAPARLKGTGQKIWKVAFANDGTYRVGFGTQLKERVAFNDFAEVNGAFDASKSEPIDLTLPANQIAWRKPTDGAAGWDVRLVGRGEGVTLVRNGQEWQTIKLDPNMQGPARSYCWLTDPAGKPFAIAIGTDTVWGVFVYAIGEQREQPRLLRYYRDHTGYVTSISVSTDGKYLASSSIDQTVKIWSLEGLRAPTKPFAQASGWGATFELRNGQVVVTSTIEAGTAVRKGLRTGDVIVEAEFAGYLADAMNQPKRRIEVPDNPELNYDAFVTDVPNVIFAALERGRLSDDFVLTIQRLGHQLSRKILLKPAWEPLLTWYQDSRGQWAFWTRLGYYDSSVDGDELFGWHMNRGWDVKPDFYRADQFRRALERPQVIRRVLELGSMEAALRAANEEIPANDDAVVMNQVDQTPRITIVEPLDDSTVGRDEAKVIAQVEYPTAQMADNLRMKAYVNGVPGGDPVVQNFGRIRRYEWSLSPPDFYNRVQVLAEDVNPDRTVNRDHRHFRLRGAGVAGKPKMHMLLLAANDYLGGPLPKLKFPKLDAESVRKQIETQSGELYDLGVVRTIYNQDVTRANVEAEISKLVAGDLAKVRSDDLLTVFVAGHGFAFGDEYYFVPPSVDLRSLGDAKSQAEFDEGLKTALRKDGVPWETLKRLAEVRCRKVFLLDTCYAGNIQLKSAIRPLSQKRILVISATAENKPAMEADFLGHGAFTKSFLDGLQGAADSPRKTGTDELQRRERDGRIDLDEIADFVTKNVPEFARTEEYRQTPMYSPTELFEYFVPLVTARSGAGQ